VEKHVKAGNCFEMCAVAFAALAKKELRPLTIVQSKGPAGHAFVAIGLNALRMDLNSEIAGWGEGVAICDPWAKVWATAAEYEGRWRDKMTRWAACKEKYKGQS